MLSECNQRSTHLAWGAASWALSAESDQDKHMLPPTQAEASPCQPEVSESTTGTGWTSISIPGQLNIILSSLGLIEGPCPVPEPRDRQLSWGKSTGVYPEGLEATISPPQIPLG